MQTLKIWQPLSCSESDDDDESDYFADISETSASSSPSDYKVSDSDNAEGKNRIIISHNVFQEFLVEIVTSLTKARRV